MALLRFSPGFDPVSNLLALQNELQRYLRNPAIRLGVSGPSYFPPVNIFDDEDGIVVMTEIPGIDPAKLNVSGQSKAHSAPWSKESNGRNEARPVLS